MMVENHYDDEVLIAMLDGDPESVASDPHLAACPSCRGILDNVRLMAGALTDECVWDRQELNEAPVPETIDLLRATAARMDAEDAQAEAWLAEMLAGPRESWMPRLEQHPEWRTAGVVRRLVARAEKHSPVMPPEALEMTKIATEVAGNLASYSDQILSTVRGEAWRERAYAEFYVDFFEAAFKASTAAEQCFSQTAASSYQLARTRTTHAMVLASIDRTDEALDEVRAASAVFSSYGDKERSRLARAAEAWIRTTNSDFRGALQIWVDDEQHVEPSSIAHAETLVNIGSCYRELGESVHALPYFERAVSMYSELDAPVAVARLRWSLATLYQVSGRWSDALQAFESAKKQLMRLELPFEAVLVDLDVSAVLLAIGCPEDVEKICRDAIRYFQNEGLSYSRNALTALAYLTEAAEQKRATPAIANRVRRFIEKLPVSPDLLFLP